MELREPHELLAALRDSGSVFAEEELAALQAAADDEDDPWQLEMMVERRTLGEPIEHIVGAADFAELRIIVHQGVFVPRRRTRLLATVVADRLREVRDERPGRAPRLLDLGCGSGAVAALAIRRVPGIEVVAIDADPLAAACARENLPGALVLQAPAISALDDLAVAMLHGAADAADAGHAADAADAAGAAGADVADADAADDAADADAAAAAHPGADGAAPSDPEPVAASALFDVIAANLPYVPTAELELLPHEARDWEPTLALDGGWDGLDPLGEHAPAMAAHLRTGGIAVVEITPKQIEDAAEILLSVGFAKVEVRADDEIGATVLVATR